MERTSSSAQIRGILFDLDGTLIDTVALILASMRHATRSVLAREYSDEDLMRGVGTPLDDQMRALSDEACDELTAAYREHNDEVHDSLIREYPGIEELLRELGHSGVPMGVVTSKRRSVALRGMDLFGMQEHFDVVICADDVAKHKPDPLPILAAAEIMELPPEEVAYVGDSPYDIEAARAAGATSIAVTWGVFGRGEMEEAGPDYVVETVDELRPLLESLSRVPVRH